MRSTRTNVKTKIIVALSAGFLCAASVGVLAGAPQDPSAPKKSEQTSAGDSSTSLNDQTELAVTVYNSNIALVRDVRQIAMPTRIVSAEIHGYRRHRESCDGTFSFAHRSDEA